MVWVKLDDHFADHPKIEAVGPYGGWLYVCGLCYCNRHLTGGFIPDSVVPRLAPVPAPRKLAQLLVAQCLWTPVEGGYQVHDYEIYQAQAMPDAVATEREQSRARVKRWREKRNGVTPLPNEPDSGGGNGGGTPAPYPNQYLESSVSSGSNVPPPTPPTRMTTQHHSRQLADALTARGIAVAWPANAELEVEVARLVDVHGARRLADHAAAQWQPNNPAHTVKAFLAGWQALPMPARKRTTCPAHDLEEPCRSCAADRLAGPQHVG